MKSRILYWFRLLVVGLVGGSLLACPIVEIIYIAQITASAPSYVGSPDPAAIGFSYQAVTILNERENIRLSGWYVPSRNGAAVILLHGYGATRLEMAGRAAMLSRRGFGVLLYDMRGHGESGGSVRAFGWLDDRDVEYALRFLQGRPDVDPQQIGILGFSVGGMVAIRAAAEYPQLRAVIADNPGFVTVADAPLPENLNDALLYSASWVDYKMVQLWTGISPPPGVIEVIGKISPRPILLIETGQGPSDGERLSSHYFEFAGEPKFLWKIPEAFHGGQVAARPQEYEERMIAFFTDSLLDRPDE